MQRFYDVVLDQFGNPANGVLVTVYDAGTTTPATLYRDSDNLLDPVNVIGNPFTTSASGIVAFAAVNGQYTINYSGSSITPRTFTWVTFTDGSVSSVPWGSITGTLSDQTDLDTALGLKAPSASPTFTVSATFSFLTNTRVPFAGVGGALTDSANLTYTGGQFYVADTTATTSTTTGAIRSGGGIGAAGAGYFGGALTCDGTLWGKGVTNQFGQTGGSAVSLSLYAAAGQNKFVNFNSGASLRWVVGQDATSESGSNAGSNFIFRAHTDAGATIDDVMNVVRAAGGTITFGSTSRPVSIAKTANAAEWIHGSASELLTIAAAATTDTTANLLPANAIIEAVVVRVTTVIPTAATFSVGDATTAARFATGVAVAATTTAVGLTHCDQTGAAGPKQTAAAKIRITPNLTPGAATGVVRITVFYRSFVPPQS